MPLLVRPTSLAALALAAAMVSSGCESFSVGVQAGSRQRGVSELQIA